MEGNGVSSLAMTSLLAIDVGNSDTKLGLFEGEELVEDWRISTGWGRTKDEHLHLLSGLLGDRRPDAAAIASVVPPAIGALRVAVDELVEGEVLGLEAGVRTGMAVVVDNPRDVGADRIANAVAARSMYGTPVVVVDMGTVTTFDVIDADGRYIGGAIAPGVRAAIEASVDSTATLRRVELEAPENIIGKSTEEAMQAGHLWGFVGLVSGLLDGISAELGTDCPVVATGGLSGLIAPGVSRITARDRFLTLRGIREVWEKNQG